MAPGIIWTKEECEKLNYYVQLYGKKWTPIASLIGSGKNGKQCRRHWERLNMHTRQGSWTPEEDDQLRRLHAKHGNKWTFIARKIGGRTDNAVKNRYHALQNKEKSKLIAKMDHKNSSNSVEKSCSTTTTKPQLKHFTSLDRYRAEMEQRKLQSNLPQRHFTSSVTNDTQLNFNQSASASIKDDFSNSNDFLCNDGAVGQSWSGMLLSTSLWTAPASQSMFASKLDAPMDWDSVNDLGCLLNSGQISDDLDSMESCSNEISKRDLGRLVSDHLSYEDSEKSVLISSEFASDPFSSKELRNCDFDSSDTTTTTTTGSMSLSSSNDFSSKKKSLNLTVDLSFSTMSSRFDFEDLFQKFSPSSPSAFLKCLNPPVV